jgi:hypothetical protein
MTTITQGRFFAEETFFMPRDEMGDPGLDRTRAPGAGILFRRIGDGNVLNDERLPTSRFNAPTTRSSTQLEGHMLVAFRTIAPGH